MKNTLLLLSFIITLFSFQTTDAQIWRKITKKAEQKLEKKAEEKIDDVLNGEKKKKDTKEQKQEETKRDDEVSKNPDSNDNTVENNNQQKTEIWRNYKFIPGEKVIFFDDLKFEEVGEFPSRWDLVKGGAEVASFNKEKVIITTDEYFNTIIPLFENKNYLSDEFTVEFDVYVEESDVSNYWVETIMELIDATGKKVKIELQLDDGETTRGYIKNSDFPLEKVSIGKLNAWHHIALSYHKGKTKVYFDDKRIGNLPRLGYNPASFSLGFRGYASGKNNSLNTAVKNVKIAHGGGQMYKRIMADGKYVTNGILFDSGKAIIKPQSMGIINKIVTVMKENPDWEFQIIGHTDSDGTDENNLKLSEQRANAVKQAIANQGIKTDRLTTIGKGETQPVNANTTPEQKANNRRVEFIKN